jgi:branched-chain amino acid transport system substrate-binding protein
LALNCPRAHALRCPDGRKIHTAYVFEVKKPEEAKYPGDYYKLRAAIPADEAFRPAKEGNCPVTKE